MATNNKHKEIFNCAPIAIVEYDCSAIGMLSDQLKRQTVTNIRQYLTEHTALVKKTFRKVKIREANNAALEMFSAKSKTSLNENLAKILTTTGGDVLVELFINLLTDEKDFNGEFKYKARNKKFQDVFIRSTIPANTKGGFSRVIITLQDITIWKRIERQLRKRAQLDGLTKLLNHSTIMQRLDEELIRAKRYGLSLSVVMIDLDHFKVINDKFGHQRGDQVLKRVAQMIKNCVRNVDIVGRYGGDEFLILLPETKAQNARYAAIRIQKMFSNKDFKYQKIITFHISLSIGISGFPSKKVRDSRDLIALADKAMYEAKKAGRNNICIV